VKPLNQLDFPGGEKKQGPVSRLPPTPKMLERLAEYIDHPAMTPHLDSLMTHIPIGIKTRGGTGVMLNWMKTRIQEWEGD